MKKIAFFLTCIICLFVIQGLVRSIISLWEKQDVFLMAERELAHVKKENSDLKKQEKEVKDPGFIEKEARNKLFLVKPDEKIVLVPKAVLAEKAAPDIKAKTTLPVPLQWLSLFVSGTISQKD